MIEVKGNKIKLDSFGPGSDGHILGVMITHLMFWVTVGKLVL